MLNLTTLTVRKNWNISNLMVPKDNFTIKENLHLLQVFFAISYSIHFTDFSLPFCHLISI